MKKMVKLASLLMAGLVAVGLTGCTDEKTPVATPDPDTQTVVDDVAATKTKAHEVLASLFDAVDRGAYDDEVLDVVDQIHAYGKLFIDGAQSSASVADALATIQSTLAKTLDSAVKYASGVQSFVAASYAERTEILAILEAYAYENFLTGFAFIDDGGYTLYSKTVKRGVDTYVPGYGWATLSDGDIVGDLTGPGVKPEYSRYYHTFETSDPGHINYADDDGSVVGDLVGYVASTYWGTRLNETNDGYEWYSETAKEKPVAVNANPNTGLATKYEWKMKTGADGLTYATNSSNSLLAKYNGQAVAAQDYITPYRMYYTQSLGWERSAENLEGAGSIKGSAAYYNASANGFNAAAWENVGLKVEERDGEWVMSVEFNSPCTPFYAMYYMNSSMFAPVPEQFVKDLGALNGGNADNAFEKGCEIFGKTSADLGLSPVDTYLSTGVYYIEAWVPNQEIVFKRNENYTACGEGRYKIAGIHFDILTAANTDPEAAWKEFNAGNLSSCGVPSTQKQDRTRNDETAYAVYTPGSTTHKLNINACTPELWEQLFGEEGTVVKTSKDNYWDVEIAMSNKDFLLGLSWSLNRAQLAESLGRGASVNYFGDGYLSDPENGIIYNYTDAHANAATDITAGGQYKYGYSLEVAKAYFKAACETFIADGSYKSGDVITIEIAWQTESQFPTYGDPIIQMWQDAFNAVGADYGLTLQVSNWAGAVWSDVYYEKMMKGQFDIGFGSISGNALNPLNFLEVLKSDNSSGFTLNWGCDTNKVEVEYNGELWSFDSLWQAAETGGYFSKGEFHKAYDPIMSGYNAEEDTYDESCYTENADGTVTLVIDVQPLMGVDGLVIDVEKVFFDGYNAAKKYVEWECEFEYNAETGELIVTVAADAVATLFGGDNYYTPYYGHYVMIDVQFNNAYNEVPSSEMATIEFAPEWM